MKIISHVSQKTLVFSCFIGLFTTFGGTSIASAGTDGTPEGETARLQDEVTAARNALEALALQPGVKRDDPRLKAKAAILEEKTKAFNKGFQDSLAPSPRPTHYPNTVLNAPNGEREEKPSGSEAVKTFPKGSGGGKASVAAPSSPSTPETVLSGEGLPKEINYPKKSKDGKVEAVEEAVSESEAKADSAGLSEIQYPKKPRPSPKAK